MDAALEQTIKAGLRTIAAAVPGAGFVAQAWSEYESKLQCERIDEFIYDCRDRFREVEGQLQALEHHIKASGELPILMERVVLKVRREASHAKRHKFALAMTHCLAAGPALTIDDKIDIIEALDTLSEHDIQVLYSFINGTPLLVNSLVFARTDAESDVRMKMARIVTALSKLEARGLIAHTTTQGAKGGAIALIDEPDHWTSRWLQKPYELLPLGSMLLQAIREPQ